MNYLILRGFCIGPGIGDATPGEERDDIPGHLVRRLITQGKIKALDTTESADAAMLARESLLKQIALAPDVEALEKLLSEDPEIVAAYEKRLEELSTDTPKETKSRSAKARK